MALAITMALKQLGYNDVYHMREVFTRNDADLWVAALEAKYEGKGAEWGREEWDRLLGDCMVRRHFEPQVLSLETCGCRLTSAGCNGHSGRDVRTGAPGGVPRRQSGSHDEERRQLGQLHDAHRLRSVVVSMAQDGSPVELQGRYHASLG